MARVGKLSNNNRSNNRSNNIYIYIYIYVCILHGIVSVVVSRKAKEFNEDGLSFVNGHQVLN